MKLNKILPKGGTYRHGADSTWTGNDTSVLELLFKESYLFLFLLQIYQQEIFKQAFGCLQFYLLFY